MQGMPICLENSQPRLYIMVAKFPATNRVKVAMLLSGGKTNRASCARKEKKKMQKFMLEKSPKVYDWKESESCDEIGFDEYDMKEMNGCIPDAVFYWYVSGSYEGDGALIAVKDGKWYDKSLSHCSCYGPIEGFANKISDYDHADLDDVLSKCSEEREKEYSPLVELARSHGYK